MVGGLIGTVLSILDTPELEQRLKPGQGVRASLQNGVIVTLLLAVLFGGIGGGIDICF